MKYVLPKSRHSTRNKTKSWSKTRRMNTKSITRVYPSEKHTNDILQWHFLTSSKSRSSTKTWRTSTGIETRIFISILIKNLAFTFIWYIHQSHILEGFICLGGAAFVWMKFQYQLSIRLFDFTLVGRSGYFKYLIIVGRTLAWNFYNTCIVDFTPPVVSYNLALSNDLQ